MRIAALQGTNRRGCQPLADAPPVSSPIIHAAPRPASPHATSTYVAKHRTSCFDKLPYVRWPSANSQAAQPGHVALHRQGPRIYANVWRRRAGGIPIDVGRTVCDSRLATVPKVFAKERRAARVPGSSAIDLHSSASLGTRLVQQQRREASATDGLPPTRVPQVSRRSNWSHRSCIWHWRRRQQLLPNATANGIFRVRWRQRKCF